MAHRVCPPWIGYFLVSPLRRLFLGDPSRLLAPHVHEGMTVLEPGPGMGFFTLPLARLVGSSGRVVAVDVQPKMIHRLKQRALKAGLLDRIDTRITCAETMSIGDLNGKVDFILAFAMVHEFPDAGRFFAEAAEAAKRGAHLLLAEPRGHVDQASFGAELKAASEAGFKLSDRLSIRQSHAAMLVRS